MSLAGKNACLASLLFAEQTLQRSRRRLGGAGLSLLAAVAIALLQQRERGFEHLLLLGLHGLESLRPIADFGFLVLAEAGAGWDEVAEDHVLLETNQMIDLAG